MIHRLLSSAAALALPTVHQTLKEVGMEAPKVYALIDDHPVRAKAEYPCAVCGGSIFKTQRYRRVVYKVDGEFRMDRVHMRCYH